MSIDLRMLDSSDGLSPPSSPQASGGTLFNPSSPVVTAASSTAFAASPVSSLPWSLPVFSSSASGSARSNPGPNQERDTQVTPASTQPSTPRRATGASPSTRVLRHSSSLFAVSYPSSSSSPVTKAMNPIPGLVVNGPEALKKLVKRDLVLFQRHLYRCLQVYFRQFLTLMWRVPLSSALQVRARMSTGNRGQTACRS